MSGERARVAEVPRPGAECGAEMALVKAWRSHGPDLRRRCLAWMGGRRDDADEAFSRAGLLAFEKYPARRCEVLNLRSWLLKLTYHVCMDVHRERRRRREHSLGTLLDASPESVDWPDSSPAANPEACYLARELGAHLQQWLEELPSRLRAVTTLHVVHDMPYREVAPALGISEANARKRMQEARAILRGRVQDYLTPGSSAARRGDRFTRTGPRTSMKGKSAFAAPAWGRCGRKRRRTP